LKSLLKFEGTIKILQQVEYFFFCRF